MNLVLILVSAFVALGAAVNAGSPPLGATTTAVTDTASAADAPAPTATPTPAPYDVISGGGPAH
ncbi:MAG TPA: hypothetical protein VIW69_08840 [Candidatus Elarobacter sp.]